MLWYGAMGYPSTPADYAALIATGVGVWGVRRPLRRYGIFLVAVGAMVGVAECRHEAPWAEVVADVILVAFAWLAGWGVRAHEGSLRAGRQLAIETAGRRLAEEQLAMAAVLHDHVARALVLATRELEVAEVVPGARAEHLSGARQRLRETLGEVEEPVNSWSRGRGSLATNVPTRSESHRTVPPSPRVRRNCRRTRGALRPSPRRCGRW